MSKKVKIIQTTLSVLILLLVLVNILIGLGNQSLQAEVGERQQVIAQTMQLEALNRQLITVLVNLAMKTNDEQLKKVLAESGINLSMGPEAAPPKK
jgi:predicted Holliday junction resolvase-like endonuclease